MPTHLSWCRICGKQTYCSEDVTTLGIGGGGCFDEEKIKVEFCSLACFIQLLKNIEERVSVTRYLYPDWQLPEITIKYPQ